MARKKIKNSFLIGFVIAMILLGIYFLYFGSQKGIWLDCDTGEILGIKNIPPPLMSIYQPTYCKAGLTAKTIKDEQVVCFGSFTINNVPRGIFPCSNIVKYKNQEINVQVTFYTPEGKAYKTSNKMLIYRE